MVSKIFYEKIEEIYILCLLGEVFCRTKLMCMNTMKLNNLVFDLCIVALKKRKKEGGGGEGKDMWFPPANVHGAFHDANTMDYRAVSGISFPKIVLF